MSRRMATSTALVRSLAGPRHLRTLYAAAAVRFSSTTASSPSPSSPITLPVRIPSANPLSSKRNAFLRPQQQPQADSSTPQPPTPATMTAATTVSVDDPQNLFLRITLRRSAIGLPRRTRDVLASLGLRRRGSVVFRWAGDRSAAGMVMKVKELVGVDIVKGPEPDLEEESAAEAERQAQSSEAAAGGDKKRRNPGVTELPSFVPSRIARLEAAEMAARSSYGPDQGFWVESRGGVTLVQPRQ